jgi:hypothetical protein
MQMYHLGGCQKKILLDNDAAQQPRKVDIQWFIPHWPMKSSGFILLRETVERKRQKLENAHVPVVAVVLMVLVRMLGAIPER